MYDKSDPRAALAAPAAEKSSATEFAAAEYGRFYEGEPQESGADGRGWYFRGQNLVLNYMEALPGATLRRAGQVDEYAVILPDPKTAAEITCGGETVRVLGESIVFVPPGDSKIVLPHGGRVVRLVTARSADLVAKCSNAAAYEIHHPNIPPFEAWPDPTDGYRIRSYSLVVPPEPGRFGRIFRCSTFMVNFIDPFVGPRDATKMSPHSHDDFEQCSLALGGSFMHYIRWPWTTNLNVWRDDDKAFCGTPSVAVIPPPAIHTTRAVGTDVNILVDIFSPPRVDFSEKPGWVLNAADYPMPK